MEFELISLYKVWVEAVAWSAGLEGDAVDMEFFNNLLADLKIVEKAVVSICVSHRFQISFDF